MPNTPRILLVDDKAENRALLEIYLDELPVQIDEADSGKACLEMLKTNDYMMVILDVQMPEMDGFEVLEIMRKTPELEEIPVIFVSAILDSDEHILRGIEGGAIDFIPKPVNGMILTSKVSNFIGVYEKQKKLDMLVRKLENTNQRLKENERKFKRITQSANDAIILLYADYKIRFWNNASTHIFGYNKFEIVAEDFLELFIDEESRPLLLKYLKDEESGKSVSQTQIKLTAVNNKKIRFPIELSLASFQTATGERNFTVIVRDMTQRERMEKEAREARELREANKVIKEFMDNVSHELRTPMNAIIGISNMLSKYNAENLTEKQSEGLEIIHQSGSRLLDMINDVLDISRIESNKVEVREEEFNLDQLLAILKSLVLSLVEQKNIKFLIKTSSSVPKTVISDSKLLQQILINLLSNAVKFTPEGKIQLYIHYTENRLNFEVSDTGIGIEQKDLKRIFQRFQQIDNTASKEYKGTGLGLNIVSKLVELLKGEISVESTPGEGTTMKFHIPVRVVETNLVECKQASPEHLVCHDIDQFSKKLAFVLDSNRNNEFLITHLLRETGYRIITCTNAQTCMHVISIVRPDLLIINLEMEKIHGTSIIKWLKNCGEFSSLPILAHTSFDHINIDKTSLNMHVHQGGLKESVLLTFLANSNIIKQKTKEVHCLGFYEVDNRICKQMPEHSVVWHNSNAALSMQVLVMHSFKYIIIDGALKAGENMKLLRKIMESGNKVPGIFIIDSHVEEDIQREINGYGTINIVSVEEFKNSHSIEGLLKSRTL